MLSRTRACSGSILLSMLGLLALSTGSSRAATGLTAFPTNVNGSVDPDDVTLSWSSSPLEETTNGTNVTWTWLYYEIGYTTSTSTNAAFRVQARYTTNEYRISGLETTNTNNINLNQWRIREFYRKVENGKTNTLPMSSATAIFTNGAANPNKAISPVPTNKATLFPDSGTGSIRNGMSWSPGPAVATNTNVSYDVYFGKDATPDETEFRGNTTGTNYLPGNLEEHTRYYWRVDTVLNGTNVIEGRLWYFDTRGNEDIFLDTGLDKKGQRKGVTLVPAQTNFPPTNAPEGWLGWVSSTNGNGFRGFDFIHDNGTNKGQLSVTYRPEIPAAARYEVFVRWAASPDNATNTPFTVNYDGGSTTLTMNQRSSAGLWRRLGTFNFKGGTNKTNWTGTVVVSNPVGTSGHVVADAVRFVSVHTNFTFTNSERTLFTDGFSHNFVNAVLTNYATNGWPTNWTTLWKASSSSAQLRSSSAQGNYVKIPSTNWIEKAISTRGMTNITVSYNRQTSEGVVLSPEWSTNGTQWIPLGAEVVGASGWMNTSQACGPEADHQPGFRLRFRTSGGSTNFAYIDNVVVKGTPTPEPAGQSPNSTNPIVKANVIFLGDSTTSNDGDNAYHWTDTVQNRLDLNVFRAPTFTDENGRVIRPTNHGKGGSKAYEGRPGTTNTNMAIFGPYGPDNASSTDGGYQRLRYAYEVDHYTNAKFVLIDFGMNDHKIVMRSGSLQEVRTEQFFYNHLKAIVEKVRTNGATPVLIVPHDIYVGEEYDVDSYSYDYPSTFFTNTNYAGSSAIERFHLFTETIRLVAKDLDVDLIDVNRAAADYDEEEFTVTGGVHMDELGHRVYGDVISRYLSERFGQTP